MAHFDKATKEWFEKHPDAETTTMECDKCGLYYKPSLGHKCKCALKQERNCKKCFHYNACKEVASHSGYVDINYTESQCKHFIHTADVVKVVRCKDCRNRIEKNWAKCAGRKPDDFCSDGIRRFK